MYRCDVGRPKALPSVVLLYRRVSMCVFNLSEPDWEGIRRIRTGIIEYNTVQRKNRPNELEPGPKQLLASVEMAARMLNLRVETLT